jgi:hypothetical protein
VWHAPAVLWVLVVWLTTPPAGLADAARREALRRAMAGPSTGSYSTYDLPVLPPPAAISGAAQGAGGDAQAAAAAVPPVEEPPTSPPAAAGAPAAAAPQAAEPKRDQKWWRERIDTARAALERDTVLSDAVQSRINALQADVVNIDDPAQQAVARQNLARALAELDRLTKQIAADRQEIAKIETEARRQRVPPGWIR